MTDSLSSLLRALPLEDGSRWSEVATDVQRADADAILDLDSPRRYHLITRSRGYSKTTDLALVAVTVMLMQAPKRSRSYAIAADKEQAGLLLDAIAGFVERSAVLSDFLKIEAWKVTNKHNGATLQGIAADQTGVWGLRPYFVVIDELAQWAETPAPKRVWRALTSAMPKTGGRLVCISTSGDPGHFSFEVRQHALESDTWRVSETEGPAPWLDPALLPEQRAALPPSLYARLFENKWMAPEDRLTTVDDLRACVTLDGPQAAQRGTRYVIGLDIGTVHDRTCAVVAHSEPNHNPETGEVTGVRVVVDRVMTWIGSRANPVQLIEVGEWLAYVVKEYNGATVVYDPHQAVELAQRLSRQGVRVQQFDFTAPSTARLALTLFQALRSRTLALPDDADLICELSNVRLREMGPGRFKLDHDPDKHDDRAVALALALHHLVEVGVTRPARILRARGLISDALLRNPVPLTRRARDGAAIAAAAANGQPVARVPSGDVGRRRRALLLDPLARMRAQQDQPATWEEVARMIGEYDPSRAFDDLGLQRLDDGRGPW